MKHETTIPHGASKGQLRDENLVSLPDSKKAVLSWLRDRLCGSAKTQILMSVVTLFLISTPAFSQVTFTVNNTGDAGDATLNGVCETATGNGQCTLRAAIQEANNTPAQDTINFSIGTGLQTINVPTGLPQINQPLIINATTQPGFTGTPLIELRGNNTGGDGLSFTNNGTNTVRGLIIDGFTGNGLSLSNSNGNVIAGNFIGTNAAGTAASANGQNGILVQAANCTIGGVTANDRNVISGNTGNGILVQNSAGTVIIGNFIGTNAAGSAGIGNGQNGIRAEQPVTIGGGAAGQRNVISGNTVTGINTFNVGTTSKIQGNYVGVDVNGTVAIPNQTGMVLGDVALLRGFSNSFVGTDSDGVNDATEGNVVSGNTLDGIVLTQGGTQNVRVSGNIIGLNAAGTAAVGNGEHGVVVRNDASGNFIGSDNNGTNDPGEANTISGNGGAGVAVLSVNNTNNRINQNQIFANGGLGIDLSATTAADGVTLNDTGDADSGGNSLQNFPIITDVRQGSTIVSFTFNSTANTTFRIEFFSNQVADPSAHGEGQTFLGSTNVTTDGSGNFTGTFTSPTTVPLGQVITATATNPAGGTSEFSNTQVVLAPTAVKFTEATAVRSGSAVLLRWRTAAEVDNLGFNVYRDDNGQKSLLTKDLVAGSALFAGATLTAGNDYLWSDKQATGSSTYWIEDVDLNGRRTLHGPIVPQQVFEKFDNVASPLLSELVAKNNLENLAQHEWPAFETARKSVSLQPNTALINSLPAIKLSVDHDGWYRVTQPQLVAAGLDPNGDARLLQLFVDGAEVPIELSTNGTQLSAGDSLEFYGQALDTPTTGTHVYYLVNGTTPGKRIPVVADKRVRLIEPLGDKSVASFTNTSEREDNSVYFSSLLNGEADNIFGPVVNNAAVTQTLVVQSLAGPASSDALEVALQGVTDLPHQVHVALNDIDLGVVSFQGKEHQSLKLQVPSGLLKEGENKVTITSTASSTDISLLDYLRLTYQKQYRATNNRLLFTVPAGRRVSVAGFTTAQLRLLDITDPGSPTEREVSAAKSGGSYLVNIAATGINRTLLLLPDDDIPAPTDIETRAATNLSAGTHAADLLIITHQNFRSAAENLAAWRRSQGLAVEVADVDQVFDEFSYGMHTPLALKNFLLWTTTHWQKAPRYVLLFGDSSWDPRNYLGNGAFDFVPTRLLDTANMETASDDWLADFDGDGVPEMAVGRLPVRTLDQATAMVNKLVAYDQAPIDPQRGALLVADSGFETMSNNLRSLLPATMPVTLVNRSSGPDDATIRSAILARLNSGPELVGFAGHGSVTVWTGAGLLRSEDAPNLGNNGRLPVMILLTCLNGYSHDPVAVSLGKAMVLAPSSGAIATWSSSGMTEPTGQLAMAQRFYGLLFGNSNKRLGEAILNAKAATTDPDVRYTWILLGDPTVRLR
ncbi:MAG TPA: C25 family cysteine peptidase [Pyrinomonadaceae bacterium]|nr:C25 family cysteine peptidase [Pyrinomonadaceae bacterium]